jgi:hypothetical protein
MEGKIVEGGGKEFVDAVGVRDEERDVGAVVLAVCEEVGDAGLENERSGL